MGMKTELEHIRQRLNDEGNKTVEYFKSLSPEEWECQIYQVGSEWRVREVLAHFISAERAYQKYLREVLEGGQGAPENMDIDEFNESEVPGIEGSPAELIEKFKQVRIDTIYLTESLGDEDLDRVANHPWFEAKDVRWYLKLLYRHNTMHRMDIRKAIKLGAPLTPTDEHRSGRQVDPPAEN
jgi:hypothetical protein